MHCILKAVDSEHLGSLYSPSAAQLEQRRSAAAGAAGAIDCWSSATYRPLEWTGLKAAGSARDYCGRSSVSLCEAEAASAARDAGGDLGTSCIFQRRLTEQSAPLTEGVTPVSAAQDEPEAA